MRPPFQYSLCMSLSFPDVPWDVVVHAIVPRVLWNDVRALILCWRGAHANEEWSRHQKQPPQPQPQQPQPQHAQPALLIYTDARGCTRALRFPHGIDWPPELPVSFYPRNNANDIRDLHALSSCDGSDPFALSFYPSTDVATLNADILWAARHGAHELLSKALPGWLAHPNVSSYDVASCIVRAMESGCMRTFVTVATRVYNRAVQFPEPLTNRVLIRALPRCHIIDLLEFSTTLTKKTATATTTTTTAPATHETDDIEERQYTLIADVVAYVRKPVCWPQFTLSPITRFHPFLLIVWRALWSAIIEQATEEGEGEGAIGAYVFQPETRAMLDMLWSYVVTCVQGGQLWSVCTCVASAPTIHYLMYYADISEKLASRTSRLCAIVDKFASWPHNLFRALRLRDVLYAIFHVQWPVFPFPIVSILQVIPRSYHHRLYCRLVQRRQLHTLQLWEKEERADALYKRLRLSRTCLFALCMAQPIDWNTTPTPMNTFVRFLSMRTVAHVSELELMMSSTCTLDPSIIQSLCNVHIQRYCDAPDVYRALMRALCTRYATADIRRHYDRFCAARCLPEPSSLRAMFVGENSWAQLRADAFAALSQITIRRRARLRRRGQLHRKKRQRAMEEFFAWLEATN